MGSKNKGEIKKRNKGGPEKKKKKKEPLTVAEGGNTTNQFLHSVARGDKISPKAKRKRIGQEKNNRPRSPGGQQKGGVQG